MWYGCNKTVPVSTTASPLSFPWEGLLFMGSHNAAGFRWWLSSEKIHQTGVILKDFSLKEFAHRHNCRDCAHSLRQILRKFTMTANREMAKFKLTSNRTQALLNFD